jgi:hypothetical protein
MAYIKDQTLITTPGFLIDSAKCKGTDNFPKLTRQLRALTKPAVFERWENDTADMQLFITG